LIGFDDVIMTSHLSG